MKTIIASLLVSFFSLPALAEPCYVTKAEAENLLQELEQVEDILIYPSQKKKCSLFRISQQKRFLSKKDHVIVGFCDGDWEKLELSTLYVSKDGTGYTKLDQAGLCNESTSPTIELPHVGKNCSVADGLSSSCYQRRSSPVLRVGLVYYGSYWGETDLERFKQVFTSQFAKATQNELHVEVSKLWVVPFKHQIPLTYTYNGITDFERLKRIWYWENVGTGVGQEIHQVLKARMKDELKDLDFVLAVTEAQSDGNGFSAGTVVVVEQPREVAWGTASGGWTQVLSDHHLADILTHEVGHAIGIGHASEQCTETGLPYDQRIACCKASPSGNDVMSYCRDRESVGEERVNRFEACTLDIIKTKVKPRLLEGGRRRISEEIHCE